MASKISPEHRIEVKNYGRAKKDDLENNAKQPNSNLREFKEYKLNGVVVHVDRNAPCDGEFEWMTDNNDN
jgi:hypothetical protein